MNGLYPIIRRVRRPLIIEANAETLKTEALPHPGPLPPTARAGEGEKIETAAATPSPADDVTVAAASPATGKSPEPAGRNACATEAPRMAEPLVTTPEPKTTRARKTRNR